MAESTKKSNDIYFTEYEVKRFIIWWQKYFNQCRDNFRADPYRRNIIYGKENLVLSIFQKWLEHKRGIKKHSNIYSKK